MLPRRALSLHQPYAYFVADRRCEFPKRVENRPRLIATWRNWEPSGEFWIHASKGGGEAYWAEAVEYARRAFGPKLTIPRFGDVPRGGIVGRARIAGIVMPHRGVSIAKAADEPLRPALDLRWHFLGSWGYVLVDVRPCEFVPCRGAQGFFSVRPDVLRELERVAA